VIVAPDRFLVKLGFYPTRDEIAESWRAAHRAFSRALRNPRVSCGGIVCGVPGAGKSTWVRNNDSDAVVLFDAVFSHLGQRRAMATRIRASGKNSIAVHILANTENAVRRMSMRSIHRRVPPAKIRASAQRFERSPPSVDEGWTRVVFA